MKEITLQNVDITNGVVIFGNIGNLDLVTDIESKVKALVGENYQKIQVTSDFLTKLAENDSQERKDTFKTDVPNEQRKYSLVFVSQEDFTKAESAVSLLISEKRPLKLILVLQFESITLLSKETLDVIFGNYPNFIIGELTPQDETLLRTRLDF